MGRNSHDGACSISRQHVVANPNGNGLVGKGIHRIASGELAGNFFGLGHPLTFSFAFHLVAVCLNIIGILGFGKTIQQLRLWSKHHEGCPIDGVGTGGKNFNLLPAIGHAEKHFCPFRAANPVSLYFLKRVCPVQLL